MLSPVGFVISLVRNLLLGLKVFLQLEILTLLSFVVSLKENSIIGRGWSSANLFIGFTTEQND